MFVFTDIVLTTALPLHPFIAANPCLSVALSEGEEVCAETPAVDGDLKAGIWQIDSRLSAEAFKQSVTLAVVASEDGARIRVASVTLSVAELLTRIKAQPDGYHEFMIGDSDSSIPELVMTCSVNALPSLIVNNPPSDINTPDINNTVYSRTKKNRSSHEPGSSELPSRERLESIYANAIRLPDRNGLKACVLSMLGCMYFALYQKEGGRVDLEMAISLHEKVLHRTEPFQPQWAMHAHQLSIVLAERFDQSGDIVDIERAILYLRAALIFTGDLDADKPNRLTNLGIAFQGRFQRLGNLADLEDGLSSLRKAVQLTPDGHPHEPSRLNNLGNALQTHFCRLGRLTDLEDAISSHLKAVQLTPDAHPDKPCRLSNLGNTLRTRFDRLGGLADMEDGISSLRQAVQLVPDGHPDKPGFLSKLATALQSRADRLGGLPDLEDALSSLRKAVQLTPDGHPDKPMRLSNLGVALKFRFDRFGGLADLENGLSSLQEAVQLTPDGHPDKPDLEDAILNKQRAVELTPDGHPDRVDWLTALGYALTTRFSHLGGLADVENAISHLRHAVQLTSDGHPSNPRQLNYLANAPQIRFGRLGGLADLEDAISCIRHAVQLTPDGHPNYPGFLCTLSASLRTRFDHLGGLADLEDGISHLRHALQLTPDGHYHKPTLLNNLGAALQTRVDCLGDLADLEDAISNLRQAVQMAPDGHPENPGRLNNLGNAFIRRFRRHGILSDLDDGLSAFSAAANSTSGSAMARFKVARAWAMFSELYSRSPLEAFGRAINILPQIAWLGLAVPDQHALLADVGGIVREAVAAAIRYEEYETAVVWAEQGRSIVWQNLLGLRNPLDDLREAYPELANRLRRIAAQLEGPVPHEPLGDKNQKGPVEDVSHKYSKLVLEWENLVEEIRTLPTFEGFLKAKTFHQLAPAAHEGPVVILNVNDVRCDALVLIADESAERNVSAVNIPLERFSHKKSKKMFKTLTELLSSAGVRERSERKTGRTQFSVDGDTRFKAILRILWQDVVNPVIEGLTFQTESNRPPRIWWCATGLLTFLPIHAAGLYDTQEVGEKVSDYVVSSYTPTLNAILELSDPVIREDFQILTVAQASAPGAQLIPKTEDEVKIVQSLVTNARTLNLTGKNATVEQVREGMMQSNWIHLACHGQQNTTEPMNSGFLLHDRILSLSEIVKMSLPKADFAFLSACQTAMGDEKVAEESVHLAAGMFLSGCRGVIATTWSIRDDDAPKVAQEVYSRMFKGEKLNRKEAAYGLHEAVKSLRESGAPCTAWVPFIHIGR